MGTVDTRELRRLHEAAREGPWLVKNFVGLEIRCDRNWTLAKVETLANALLIAAARNALPSLLDRLEELERENVELKGAIERDRTTLADFVTRLKTEMDSRFWLTEGRGSYAWNDDRYRDEFRSAAVSILDAIKPLKKMAADLKNSPRDSESVRAARRDLEAALAAERKRVAELEADRERLDLMEELHDAAPWPDTDEQPEGPVVRVWIVTRNGEHKPYGTLREAIDAAREAKG